MPAPNTSSNVRHLDRVYRFDHVGVVQQTFIVRANSESEAKERLGEFIEASSCGAEGSSPTSCVEARPTRVDPRVIDLPIGCALAGGQAEKDLVNKVLAILSLKIQTGYKESKQ